eukprot:423340-Pelagomonas_calceolata.AAC.1
MLPGLCCCKVISMVWDSPHSQRAATPRQVQPHELQWDCCKDLPVVGGQHHIPHPVIVNVMQQRGGVSMAAVVGRPPHGLVWQMQSSFHKRQSEWMNGLSLCV